MVPQLSIQQLDCTLKANNGSGTPKNKVCHKIMHRHFKGGNKLIPLMTMHIKVMPYICLQLSVTNSVEVAEKQRIKALDTHEIDNSQLEGLFLEMQFFKKKRRGDVTKRMTNT